MSVHKKLIVSVTLAAILVTGLGISWWAHRSDLSNRARRIGRLPGAVNYLQPISPEWISDHEAIYMSYHQDGDRFELTKVNTDTGSGSAMAELNAKYANELRSITTPRTRPPWHVAPDMVVSPSGKEIVLVRDDRYNVRSAAGPVVYHVIDLATDKDTAFPITQSLSNPFSPVWFPDNKQWVLPFYPGVPGATMNALLYDTDHPSSGRKTGLSAGPAFFWMPVGVTAAGKCLGYSTTRTSTSISEWDGAGNTVTNQTAIALPVPGYVTGAALSPERDRIAWLIRYHVDTPLSAIVRRIHRRAKQNPLENPNDHIGIWVSKLDCTEMRQIGTEDVSIAWYTDGYVRWLPGGKKLAFHIGMDLYTIPVDR